MQVSILHDAGAYLRALADLFTWAKRVDLACAWATADEGRAAHWSVVDPTKIGSAVIGVQFAQTEPWVLRALEATKRLRIGVAPGTFHPKVFMGVKGKRMRALVGSANLTNAAFSTNVELGVLLEGSTDEPQYKELARFIATQWSQGLAIDAAWMSAYELAWRRRPPAPIIPRFPLKVASIESLQMSWRRYYELLHAQEGRLPVIRVFAGSPSYSEELENTRAVFLRRNRLVDATPEERRLLLGLPGASSGLVGSMGAARYAKQIAKSSPDQLGVHLDRIPLTGEVSLSLAKEVVEGLVQIRGVKLGVATRLLAVKRPDLFVSVNNGSKPQLARLLSGTNVTTSSHYMKLLEAVWELDWHRSKEPRGHAERAAWQRRAALLDAVLYEQV